MIITTEMSLQDFKFWCGAEDFASKLTSEEFQQIEWMICELYPDGVTDTQLNDIFWFEQELICDWIGEDIDNIYERE